MTRFSLPACVVLSLALAAPVGAQQDAQQPEPKNERKIWTNEDLEQLRDRVWISEIGAGIAPGEAAPAEEGPAEEPGAKAREPYVRQKDPEWYQQRLGSLRSELARAESEIRRLRDFRSNPGVGHTGLVLGQANIPLSPENQIELLEQRRRELLAQIDEVEAEARRNAISPGILR